MSQLFLSVRNYCYIYREPSGRKIIYASLASNQTTLIYFSPENNFIFGRELKYCKSGILLNSYCIRCGKKLLMLQTTLQEIWEAVINSNTKDKLIFILSGDEELIYIVSNQLWFWGICKIKSKSIF